MNEDQSFADTLDAVDRALHADRADEAFALLEAVADEVRWASADYWVLRAHALLALGRFGEAIEAANWGLSISPFSPLLFWLRFEGELAADCFAEAERSILEANRLTARHPYLVSRYAELLVRAGQVEKALQVNADARTRSPDEPLLIVQAAQLAYLRGDDAEAMRQARLAVDLAPDSADAHLVLGRLTGEIVGGSAAIGPLQRSLQLGLPDAAVRTELQHYVAVASRPTVRHYYTAVQRIGQVRFVIVYGILVLGLMALNYWKWSLALVVAFWLTQGYIFVAERIAVRTRK